MRDSNRLAVAVAIIGCAFIILAYGPHAGKGFVKDDFAWVAKAATLADHPLTAFTRDASGDFYRPAVTLTFAANYAVHGLDPLGYGLTNMLLLAACVAVIYGLGRALGLRAPGAAVGALAWVMNPHGINMAVLWISGRTSLLMALLGCVALLLYLKGHRLIGSVALMGALLAKEDALAVPILVLLSRGLLKRVPARSLALDILVMAPVVAVYGWLRASSSALTTDTAPSYYQLSTDVFVIVTNALAYLDRAGTVFLVIALVVFGVYRQAPRLRSEDPRLLLFAFAWFVAGLAITVRIPVRSSLYAVFPSIGIALALAVFVDAVRSRENHGRDRRLAFVLGSLLLLLPVYWTRNVRWVEPARVSSQLMSRLATDINESVADGTIVLEDSSDRFANFGDALGTLGAEAVYLYSRRHLEITVVEPGSGRLPDEVLRYRVASGRVARR